MKKKQQKGKRSLSRATASTVLVSLTFKSGQTKVSLKIFPQGTSEVRTLKWNPACQLLLPEQHYLHCCSVVVCHARKGEKKDYRPDVSFRSKQGLWKLISPQKSCCSWLQLWLCEATLMWRELIMRRLIGEPTFRITGQADIARCDSFCWAKCNTSSQCLHYKIHPPITDIVF